MPEADAPRKSSKRWLIAPYILAVLLAAGWCGWWFYGVGQLQVAMDREAKTLAGRGVDVRWENRKVTGFPFRFMVTLDNVSIRERDGWSLTAPRIEAEAAAYNVGHWVAVAPQTVSFARSDGAKAFTVSGDILRMSASHLGDKPPKVSVEGVRMKLSGTTPFAVIDRFELHLTPDPAAQSGRLSLRIDKAQPAPDTLLARIAGGKGVIVGLEAGLAQTPGLKGAGVEAALRNWASAGGALNITQGGIQAGDALLSLKPSTVYVAPDGSLRGELGLSLTSAPQAVLAMGAIGALPQETAAVASGAAGASQLFSAPGKPIDATLTFRDGQTLLGPLPLGPAPRLF